MGALSSKIENDKVVSMEFNKMGSKSKRTSKNDMILQQYMEYLNTYGFYQIKLDANEFANSLLDKKKIFELFSELKSTEIKSTNIKPAVVRPSNNLEKIIKELPTKGASGIMLGLIMISMNGIISIHSKNEKNAKLKDMIIILPKIYIIKGKSDEFIDFIHKNFMLKMNPKMKEKDKQTILILKNICKNTMQQIQKRNNPSVILLNIFGIIIKAVTFQILTDKGKINNLPKYQNLISNVIGDIIEIIPDNKCFIETSNLKYIEITPSMCEIKKVESEKEVSYAEKTCPEEKICQETCEEEIRYIRVPDETECKQDNTWFIVSGVFITTTIIFIILYIMKK